MIYFGPELRSDKKCDEWLTEQHHQSQPELDNDLGWAKQKHRHISYMCHVYIFKNNFEPKDEDP